MSTTTNRKLTVTIVCENTVVPSVGIMGEHGFAAFIESRQMTCLFDTGQGLGILNNAGCLGIDLTRLSTILLSHGHRDHTGGLSKVLSVTGAVDVCAHPDIFLERFCRQTDQREKAVKNIGIPRTKKALEAQGGRFVFNKIFREVAPDMYLTGEIPRVTSFEKHDGRLRVKTDGTLVQDHLHDDQSLVIQSPQGLVVVLGCAHSGIINTLQHIQNNLPGRNIYMVLGGTHLGFLSELQVRKTIEALPAFSIERIGVSHCTGPGPAARLRQAFGDRCFFANAGSVIAIS